MSGSGFHATRVTAVVRLSQAKAANQLSRCCTQCVVCVCVGWCSPDAVHSVWCVCVWVVCVWGGALPMLYTACGVCVCGWCVWGGALPMLYVH